MMPCIKQSMSSINPNKKKPGTGSVKDRLQTFEIVLRYKSTYLIARLSSSAIFRCWCWKGAEASLHF